jgi:predicted outer membrane repeat protein
MKAKLLIICGLLIGSVCGSPGQASAKESGASPALQQDLSQQMRGGESITADHTGILDLPLQDPRGTHATSEYKDLGYSMDQQWNREDSSLQVTHDQVDVTYESMAAASTLRAVQAPDDQNDSTSLVVSTGRDHTCTLTASGRVFCWGLNEFGQLGDGTTINRSAPVEVVGLDQGVIAISTHEDHTCALTTDKEVKCWGLNDRGQLGDGTTVNSSVPVGVSGLSQDVITIVTGVDHTCALTASGEVICWGGNYIYGPEKIPGLSEGVVSLAIGRYSTCALTASGGVKCWGENQWGVLGDGTSNDSFTPVGVVGLSDGVKAIAAGFAHNCALTNSGLVKCWGYNGYGQLGNTTQQYASSPVNVVGLSSEVVGITAGHDHTCSISIGGGIECWGRNNYGQLGDGSHLDHLAPQGVQGLDSGMSSVSAGGDHTCAQTESGAVKCWGEKEYGQLGDGAELGSVVVDVSGLASGATAVSSGGWQSCVLTDSGTVKCWGRNFYGQVGDGTTVDRYTPVDVQGLTDEVSSIATGFYHSCVLNTSGAVKCWGLDTHLGLLNDPATGAPKSILTPTEVMANGATAITAGYLHTCALMDSGGVECWGSNVQGQLGDGTTVQSATPVAVSGMGKGVIAIAANNSSFTCAITDQGGVKCWGFNYYGALGDGTVTDRHTPVDVVGLESGVAAITVADTHACALKETGGVMCWGWNKDGQLGDGTTINRYTPVSVYGLSGGVIAIAGGTTHTCVLKETGRVVCWGDNSYGELGDGTKEMRTTPVEVLGLTDVIALSSGGTSYTCALTASGGVKCWGRNDYGQLGGGAVSYRPTPDLVIGLDGAGESDNIIVHLDSSPAQPHFPVAVTLTATVSPAPGSTGGWVYFKDGNHVVGAASLELSGQAALDVAGLLPGNHLIAAQYVDTYDHRGSTSGVHLLNIQPDSPPVISGNPAVTVAADSEFTFSPVASDPDGDPLTYSITNKPLWADFDPKTGVLSGVPTNDDVTRYDGVVISVSDGVLEASLDPFSLEVTYTNHAPTINGPVPVTTLETYAAYGYTPSANDEDGDPLVFSIANKPAWASFDAATGSLTGVPARSDAGTYPNIIISVFDSDKSASLPPFDLVVVHVNHAPQIQGVPATTVAAGSYYSFLPSAYDIDGDNLTFSISNKPSWASFDSQNGALTGVPDVSQISSTTGIVIEVSDGVLTIDLPVFNLTVTEERPDLILVTNGGDSGPDTLRQAIANASPGMTISVTKDVNLLSQLVIDKDLIIEGPEASPVTIQPQVGAETRLFHIISGNVELRNLILKNGKAVGTDGLDAVTTYEFYVYPLYHVYHTGGGGGGNPAWGGAILSETDGILTIRDVSFIDNSATGGHGGNGLLTEAMYNLFDIWYSTVPGADGENGVGGFAPQYAGVGGSAFGYKIYWCHWKPEVPWMWITHVGDMDYCDFWGLWNYGGGGGGGAGLGGAVFIARGSLDVYNSAFTNNVARGGNPGISNFPYEDPCDSLYEAACNELVGTRIAGTSGQGKGGAIFALEGSTVKLIGVQTSENVASSAGAGTPCPGTDDSDYCGVMTTSEDICSAVTTPEDLGACIESANATPNPDAIGLGADVTLLADLPAITSEITLIGQGHSLSGNTEHRVLTVSDAGHLVLNQITIRDGHAEFGGGIRNEGLVWINQSGITGNSATGDGGAIYNVGGASLTLNNATLSDNSTTGNGGGVYNAGTLTVTNSTFSGNTAPEGDGGAIYSAQYSTLSVQGSTFSRNSGLQGGAISNRSEDTMSVVNSTFYSNSAVSFGGGITNNGALAVTNSTFSRNSADNNGGGIFNADIGTLDLINTILAGSTAGGDCSNAGTIDKDVNNLIVGNSGCGEPISIVDPGLGDLKANGGPTKTMSISINSPAFNSGDSGSCPDHDQRGVERSLWGPCDIGAYELQELVSTRETLSTGIFHTCWNVMGGLLCWGDNDVGQAPPLTAFPSNPVDQVAAGGMHTCALKRDGTVQCWGDNTYGQLNQPGGTFTLISAGTYHTCGLRPDGTAVCWGAGSGSGDPHFGQSSPPAGKHFVQLSAGYGHTCGLGPPYGSITCWGNNSLGQLDAPDDEDFIQISAGGFHTCGLHADGHLTCWGMGKAGDTGWFAHGQANPPSGTFTQVSAGFLHTCGLRSNGSVACWGAGAPGTTGDFGQSTPPDSVGSFIAVSAGGQHTCALRGDHTLLCWGDDEYGQAPHYTLGPANLPDGMKGVAYSQPLQATGHFGAPLNFNIVEGSLPPGLNMGNNGLIAGTPTQAGSFDVAIRAMDVGRFTSERAYTIIINQDADNIPDAVEDAAPNGGDGNNDGTPDSQQANVASLPNAVDKAYVTIAAPEGTTLAGVTAHPVPADAPPALDYPSGMFSYEVQGLTPGVASTVTLYIPGGQEINTFYKFGPTPKERTDHWYEFLFDGTTGAVISGSSMDGYTIVLHFVDGQRGDGDLVANGEYSDPGAPAFNPDTTPPLITSSIQGTMGENGWYTSDVTVGWSVVDEESAITSRSGCDPAIVDSDTDGLIITCAATSMGGTSSESVTIRRDTTPPTITYLERTEPNTAGWNNSSVTVEWSCADDLSGPAQETVSQTLDGEGSGQTATGVCVDKAGNSADDTQADINIDLTPPTLDPTVSPDPVLRYGTATTDAGAGDELSGLAEESCGEPDTSTVGEKTLSCSATDLAGNSATAQVTYRVIFDFNGFFSPLGEPSTWYEAKAGSSIPVKFSLSGDQGLEILASGYPVSQEITCEDQPVVIGDITEAGSPGNSGLSYSIDEDQYLFNWKTDKAWSGTCRELVVRLTDGEEYTTYVKFK